MTYGQNVRYNVYHFLGHFYPLCEHFDRLKWKSRQKWANFAVYAYYHAILTHKLRKTMLKLIRTICNRFQLLTDKNCQTVIYQPCKYFHKRFCRQFLSAFACTSVISRGLFSSDIWAKKKGRLAASRKEETGDGSVSPFSYPIKRTPNGVQKK